MINSIIRTHTHENLNVLKEFSESPDSVLLYKGKPIVVTSKHETEVINTESGVHGLRYYNKKLQCYFNDKWNLYPTKVCEKKGYTINFGAEQGRKLFDIIKPYVCPSMMYKILPEMSDLKNYYGTTVLDEIIALSTLPEDKKVMEAHTTQ